MPAQTPFLSVVIKTFNEEEKIGKAIESALAIEVLLKRPVEVVIADSVSSDRTIDIACQYPVCVVQFANPAERGCGAGVELGFQHATGSLVYFLDGDMELDPHFVVTAVALLESSPQIAGVGGLIQDTRVMNGFDRIRQNNKAIVPAGECSWLEGGGLYRREAITSAGGFAANRNLKGYEEADLGMRLRAAGWKLLRLPERAATHTGHPVGTFDLLMRHWRSRRAMSGGILLKFAFGKPWFLQAVRMLALPLFTTLWWYLLFALLIATPGTFCLEIISIWLSMGTLAFAALLVLKRDLRHVLTSVLSWHYEALALAIGLLLPVKPPLSSIAAKTLSSSSAYPRPHA